MTRIAPALGSALRQFTTMRPSSGQARTSRFNCPLAVSFSSGIKFPHVNSRSLSNCKPQVPVYISRRDALAQMFSDSNTSDQAVLATDLGQVSRQYDRWVENLPSVKPFYAVKCNPDPMILQTLAQHGTGFDCATAAEIELVLATNVCPQDIIFANPVKNIKDIKFARSKKVKKMTFDNVDELHKIRSHFPEAELVLRLLPDDSGSLMRFGSKFGADEAVVPELLTEAQRLNLNVIGVSFHIGSGCYDANKYEDAISMCRRVFKVAEELGLPPLKVLDIGGGFPGSPESLDQTSAELSFEHFADVIRPSLSKHFPEKEFPHLQRISEPGRFFASNSSVLFTKVNGKRVERTDEGQPPKILYYINDGIYGSFNCIMFDHAKPVPVLATDFFAQLESSQNTASLTLPGPSYFESPPGLRMHGAMAFSSSPTRPTLSPSTIFGPTCDSLDKVVEDYPMAEMLVGDWIVFENMGAYTSAAASKFNGVPLAAVKYFSSLG